MSVHVLPRLLARPRAIAGVAGAFLVMVAGLATFWLFPEWQIRHSSPQQHLVAILLASAVFSEVKALRTTSFYGLLPGVDHALAAELGLLAAALLLPVPVGAFLTQGIEPALLLLGLGIGTFLGLQGGASAAKQAMAVAVLVAGWVLVRWPQIPLAVLLTLAGAVAFWQEFRGVKARRLSMFAADRAEGSIAGAESSRPMPVAQTTRETTHFRGGLRGLHAAWRSSSWSERGRVALARTVALTLTFGGLLFLGGAFSLNATTRSETGWEAFRSLGSEGLADLASFLIGPPIGEAVLCWALALVALALLTAFGPVVPAGGRYTQARSQIADVVYLRSLIHVLLFTIAVVGLVLLSGLLGWLTGEGWDPAWARPGVWAVGWLIAVLPLGQALHLWSRPRMGVRPRGCVFMVLVNGWVVLVVATVILATRAGIRVLDASLAQVLLTGLTAIATSQALYWIALRRHYSSCDLFQPK